MTFLTLLRSMGRGSIEEGLLIWWPVFGHLHDDLNATFVGQSRGEAPADRRGQGVVVVLVGSGDQRGGRYRGDRWRGNPAPLAAAHNAPQARRLGDGLLVTLAVL